MTRLPIEVLAVHGAAPAAMFEVACYAARVDLLRG
jgi:hypothetical protein